MRPDWENLNTLLKSRYQLDEHYRVCSVARELIQLPDSPGELADKANRLRDIGCFSEFAIEEAIEKSVQHLVAPDGHVFVVLKAKGNKTVLTLLPKSEMN